MVVGRSNRIILGAADGETYIYILERLEERNYFHELNESILTKCNGVWEFTQPLFVRRKNYWYSLY